MTVSSLLFIFVSQLQRQSSNYEAPITSLVIMLPALVLSVSRRKGAADASEKERCAQHKFAFTPYLNKDGINCPILPPTVYSSEGVNALSNLVSTAQNPTPPSEDQYTLMHRS